MANTIEDDYSQAFNTPLSSSEQDVYKKNFGDSNMTYNYDMQGFIKDNPDYDINNVPEGQHYPDTYKKPNHPTFSNESKYHGVTPGDLPIKGAKPYEGGNWDLLEDNTFAFTPGRTNLEQHSTQQLIDYFNKYEPKHKLVLPGY